MECTVEGGRESGRNPPTDAYNTPRPLVEAMSREELETEVRRLRLRLDGLRVQRDARIHDIQELERELADTRGRESEASEALQAWRLRAEEAEAAYASLMNTKTMRALAVPRAVYARLRRPGGS